jgi:hypothetical protein
MKRFLLSLLLPVLTSFFTASAQDTIRLISGKDIPAVVVEVDSTHVKYHPPDNKDKISKVENYRVFSINYSDGREKIIYRDDSTAADYFGPEQMRLFIKGEKDAKKFYKPPVPFFVGLVSGAAGAAVAPVFVALSPIPPAIGITITGSRAPDITKHKLTDPSLRDVPEFRMGFEHQARKIRMKRTLFGGCIGLSAGLAYLFLK